MIRDCVRSSYAVAFLLCGLTVLSFSPAIAQNGPQEEPTSSESYLNQSIDLETEGNTGALTNFSEQTSEQQIDTSNSSVSWYLTKTVLVLVVLSVGIWGLMKFLKKSGFGGASNKFMSIHSTLAVGQSQYLQIVQVGKQFFMIGVTDNNVNMLGEITDSDTITDLQLQSDEPGEEERSRPQNFGDMLQQFVGTNQHEFQSDGEETNDQASQLSDLKNKIEDMRKTGGEA